MSARVGMVLYFDVSVTDLLVCRYLFSKMHHVLPGEAYIQRSRDVEVGPDTALRRHTQAIGMIAPVVFFKNIRVIETMPQNQVRL